MDPKAKSSINTVAGEKSAAKRSSPVKSSKSSSQKKNSSGEPVDDRVFSPTGQIYTSDQKEQRTSSSVSGAKAGNDTKRVASSLVSRVTDYLEDEEDNNQREANKKVKAVSPRNTGSVPDASAATIGKGLRINSMTMKDSDKNNALLWAQNCRDTNLFDGGEYEAHLPAEILQCSAVTRTINFSSFEKITSFSLIQKVLLHGQCIEQWSFQFGFVIPGSTNSWEQTIFAAPRKEMLPLEVLSGNLVIETLFLNKDEVVAKTKMKIYYDA